MPRLIFATGADTVARLVFDDGSSVEVTTAALDAWLAANPGATTAQAEQATLATMAQEWPNPNGTTVCTLTQTPASDGRTALMLLQVRDSADPAGDLDVYAHVDTLTPHHGSLTFVHPGVAVGPQWWGVSGG